MTDSMTVGDWWIFAAILSGPILAVQIQKWLEDWREKKNRKFRIFESLMTTRGNTLSERHVEALNMIDLEFSVKKTKEKNVVDSWKVYRDHLYSGPQDYEKPSYQADFSIWADKSANLLPDLLFKMASCLGYKFDIVQLKKDCYRPQGHSDLEMQHTYIRRGLLNVLYGRSGLPIKLFQEPPQVKDNKKPETEGEGN